MPTFVNDSIAFIHVPKTGGTNVANTLFINEEMMITKHLETMKDTEHYLLLHCPASIVREKEPNIKTMIGFVRNPYTRFISLFCSSRGLNIHQYLISIEGIKEFCKNFKGSMLAENIIFKPMTYFLYDKSVCIVNHIYYYEEYESAIKQISELIAKDEPSEIKELNTNLYIHQSEYNDWYTKCPMLYDFVNEVYEDDFKSFNYEMITVDK